ncbi:adenylate/guanylate cyclase domain-containing protein [Mycobacterium sp. ITM-2016-00317]|uniref:adenylate/guanylate cyclase domain-containing protein n=1 Tax=Mycobacterium sp. ITM-2016-00317 TaxID=2099694 RepID=UPI00287FC356|nr:adenylate/guanylate cyclase domain-containing protein [Mycobacterium sp. ITM-2016-00317]WNG87671.1 adenylate/guanylate cyclase domain-containing protein [Mycobacterium sp. ITM-2016-00317]
MTVALSIVVLLEAAGLIALGVVLIVSRRSLASTRRALERERRRDEKPRRTRKPIGVAPLAVKTVMHTVQTADAIVRKTLGGSVRSSIDDLAGWARIERPDLARVVSADGRVVLMFSDIEGSTERNAALGDREWVQLLERHNTLIGNCVDDHHGHVVKTQGDGFMVAFAEPVDAVRCCVAVQRALRQNLDRWDGIRVRMGAHVGTSVRRGEDLFGLDVVIASRVADLADGAQILVTDAVRESVGDPDDISFTGPDDLELKGLPGTQTVYAVNYLPGP